MGKRLKEKVKKEPSNKKKIIHICTVIIVLLVVVLGSSSTLLYAIIKDRYNHSELNQSDLGINTTNIAKETKKKYLNIALFGVDSRVNSFSGLSDSIMVLTLDYENKEVKLSSFMRDSLVRIDTSWGTTYEKQTHAYSYGGAQLAVKTLNTNYDLDIQDYVTINWVGFETIINELGGLKIDVKSYELSEVNKYIRELNRVVGGKQVEQLSSTGSQLLNGRQALSYSRIRKVGNGDEERTERQRSVIDKVISKLTKMSYADLIALAYEFMPYVQTSFTMEDLVGTTADFAMFKDAPRTNYKYPNEYGYARVAGASVVRPLTLESNVIELMNFIYGIEDYEVSDTVKKISEVVESK